MTVAGGAMKPEQTHPLVNRWFHTFEGEDLHWQGHILAMVSPDLFLVQLYEWFHGDTSQQQLVPLEQMKNWKFYDTDKDMNYWYQYEYCPYAERRERVMDAELVAKWKAEREAEP
jgi:hypothetical protein